MRESGEPFQDVLPGILSRVGKRLTTSRKAEDPGAASGPWREEERERERERIREVALTRHEPRLLSPASLILHAPLPPRSGPRAFAD